jgi:FdhE protein
VAGTSWQKRIGRAKDLAAQHLFAAEILGFYARLARFQETLYRGLDGAPEGGFFDALDTNQLSNSSKPFLLMVEEYGPARLADVALRLRSTEMRSGWFDLLNETWSAPEHLPSEPEDFLARVFLQPRAEWVRSRLPMPPHNSTGQLCPYCRRKPGAGILRQQGDGGLRSLLCSFCLGEWEFRRIICPNCGEEDNRKLPVYTADEFAHIRVECCDSCKIYIKTVDLTKAGLAEPVVDEIASVPLDLWAQERFYAKLQLNVLGL